MTDDITTDELSSQGLKNLWQGEKEGLYAVRRAQQALSDFPQKREDGKEVELTNIFEKSFPTLFPYGTGGPERDRPVKLSMSDHIKWLLEQHDHRFRKHDIFPFMVYSILQRRQTLLSAKLQMRRRDFDREAAVFRTITPAEMKKATEEEERGEAISNPAIRLMKSRAYATWRPVTGSDSGRLSMRTDIQATCMHFGQPSIWATINPDDIHDPISQIFAGEDIDLDKFDKLAGPNKQTRGINIAQDPYAAAKFFDFIVKAVLETLMGVTITPRRVEIRKGVYGRVQAYYGTVECQGRGALHLHILIWLEGSYTTEEVKELLQTEDFRNRVREFIRHNVRADHPDIRTKDDLEDIPADKEFAYSRPPNPDSENYEKELEEMVCRAMRAKQMHACNPGCEKRTKKGVVYCKRGAPWPLSEEVVVEDNGEWHPIRYFEYQNGASATILVNLRCNNDFKILLNGPETRGLTFYIVKYAAKKQGKSYNTTALIRKAKAFHRENDPYRAEIRKSQRLLLFRCANILCKQQEIPMTLCIAYLMGWGDAYRTHRYTGLNWWAFHRVLTQEYPELEAQHKTNR